MAATMMETRELARLTDDELFDAHSEDGDTAARDEGGPLHAVRPEAGGSLHSQPGAPG